MVLDIDSSVGVHISFHDELCWPDLQHILTWFPLHRMYWSTNFIHWFSTQPIHSNYVPHNMQTGQKRQEL